MGLQAQGQHRDQKGKTGSCHIHVEACGPFIHAPQQV